MSSENSMAVVVAAESDQPQFLQEIVPAADKTALLFHISYLCLAKFPQLERIIRANAIEVQMAFNSSDNLLLQCINTSDNMVTSLFPRLISAVDKCNAVVAVKFLEKAKTWIQDLIREVQEMVDEYGKLNRGVASATSDVITVKKETDDKISALSNEQKAKKKQLEDNEVFLKQRQSALDQNKADIESATQELQKAISDIASRDKGLGILAAIVPFVGSIISAIVKGAKASSDSQWVEGLRIKLEDLRSMRAILSQQLGQSETHKLHFQFELSKMTFDLGAVPDPVHLPEVQQCLTRIQKILLQLKSFWEKIDVMLKDLKQKTFAGEDLVDVLKDFKDDFVESIEIAKTAWLNFKRGCTNVRIVFALKNRDAYKFLEFTPSSLTPEEWQQKYNELKAQLEEYYPPNLAIEGNPAK